MYASTNEQKDIDERILLMFWLAMHNDSIKIAKELFEKSKVLQKIIGGALRIAKIAKREIEKTGI